MSSTSATPAAQRPAAWPPATDRHRVRRGRPPTRPAEQPSAERGRLQREPLRRLAGVVAGQVPNSVQAVGDRADGQVHLPGGRGVVALVVEEHGRVSRYGSAPPRAVVSGPRTVVTRSVMASRSRRSTGKTSRSAALSTAVVKPSLAGVVESVACPRRGMWPGHAHPVGYGRRRSARCPRRVRSSSWASSAAMPRRPPALMQTTSPAAEGGEGVAFAEPGGQCAHRPVRDRRESGR